MKYFHVHVVVEDLAANIEFYSRLFDQVPSKQRPEYAKWMLEDPRVNFAISTQGHGTGLNHFGMQADSLETLVALHERADAASQQATLEQGEATCCYANSNKHWTVDPQGLAWEHFYTHSDSEQFGQDRVIDTDGAYCIPLFQEQPNTTVAQAACCLPNTESKSSQAGCCS